MMEKWAKTRVNTIEMMRDSVRDGNIVGFKAWPGFNWKSDSITNLTHEEICDLTKERITFPLASFLVGAETNCYFCYTWGWTDTDGTFVWYPEFDKWLGPPMGDAIREGYTYTREFTYASVFVDLEEKTAKIDGYPFDEAIASPAFNHRKSKLLSVEMIAAWESINAEMIDPVR